MQLAKSAPERPSERSHSTIISSADQYACYMSASELDFPEITARRKVELYKITHHANGKNVLLKSRKS